MFSVGRIYDIDIGWNWVCNVLLKIESSNSSTMLLDLKGPLSIIELISPIRCNIQPKQNLIANLEINAAEHKLETTGDIWVILLKNPPIRLQVKWINTIPNTYL